MIDVRHPDLEWHRGDLEAERHEHQQHPEKRGPVFDGRIGERGGDASQIRFAGHAENPGDAVNKKAGRERAEDQVFHAGFERGRIAAGEADQHVEGDGHELERDEDHDEIDRGSHPHETGAGEDRQREKLAETGLMGRAVDRFAHDRRVIDHHDQDENGGDERKAFEKNRERIGGVKTPEARRTKRRAGEGARKKLATSTTPRPSDGGVGESALVDLVGEHFEEQHEHAEDEHRDFESGRGDGHCLAVK